MYDSDNGLRLELANDDHPELRDAYSAPRRDAALKLAPAEAMAELLAELEAHGLSRWARPGAAPSPSAAGRAPQGIEGWIEVREDSALRSFVVPEGGSAEVLTAFGRMKLSFARLYNRVGSLQFIENPLGSRLFPRDA